MSPAITMSTTGQGKMNDCFASRQLIKRSHPTQQQQQTHAQRTVAHRESCRLGYTLPLTTTGQTHHSFPRLRVHIARASHLSNEEKQRKIASGLMRRGTLFVFERFSSRKSCIWCKARLFSYRSLDYYFDFDIDNIRLDSAPFGSETNRAGEDERAISTIVSIAKHEK